MNVNNQFQGIPNNPIMNNFNNNFSGSSMQTGNNINNNNSSNNSMSFNMLNMNSMMNNMNNNMMNNMMMNNMNNMNALNMNSMMNNYITNNNMMNNMMMNGKMNFNNMQNNINNPMMINNNNNNNNNNLAIFNSRTDFRPSNSKFNSVNTSNNKNQNIFNQNQNNDGQKNSVNISNKCGMCLEKKKKLKMCKYCNCIVCENCLKEWLKKHTSCYKCKTKIKTQDMITLPFDDNSIKNENNKINNTNSQQQNYDINKASASKPLNKGNNNNQQFISSNLPNNNMNMNINNNMNNNINNNMNNNVNNNMNNINMNNNINNISNNNMNNNNIIQNDKVCPIHKSLMVYHCVNCNKEFCSNCLLFFGQEAQKHKGHLILEISQMNNPNLKQLLDEFNKLPLTKNSLDHLIGLSNFKIRENEIKKFEINHFMNAIQEAYLKKLDEDSVELKTILEDLKKQKDIIDNSISSIPNGFNNIVNSNDYVQGGVLSQELKKINKFDNNLKYKIQEKSKNTPMLFIDNYESDFLEFKLHFGRKYVEGKDIVNQNINFIPGFPCRIVMKFLQKKVYISLLIDINVPLNQMETPKFFTYISFKNKKYGLEFSNLSEQNFPQNMMNQINRNRQQMNTVDMEAEQFLYLVEDNGKIKLKIYATMVHYKYE